jgi:hypothetical protein
MFAELLKSMLPEGFDMEALARTVQGAALEMQRMSEAVTRIEAKVDAMLAQQKGNSNGPAGNPEPARIGNDNSHG